jgi:hypothetical protein
MDSAPLARSVSDHSGDGIRNNKTTNQEIHRRQTNTRRPRKLREANDGLDSVRRAKRTASEQTTADVNSHAQQVAERENWSGRR